MRGLLPGLHHCQDLSDVISHDPRVSHLRFEKVQVGHVKDLCRGSGRGVSALSVNHFIISVPLSDIHTNLRMIVV